jgi:hypothetical protein
LASGTAGKTLGKVAPPVKTAAPAKGKKGAKATAAPAPVKTAPAPVERTSRKSEAIAMLRRKDGVTLEQLQNMPNRSVWLPHSVRGFISTLCKTVAIESTVVDGKRTYKIAGGK